jgi:hypothetical protein
MVDHLISRLSKLREELDVRPTLLDGTSATYANIAIQLNESLEGTDGYQPFETDPSTAFSNAEKTAKG